MLAKLTDKGVAQHRQVLFENWVNLQQIYPLPPAQSLRSELAIPADKVVVLYSGNMGKKQGLEIVVQAAQQLQHRHEILFILCGDGVERRQLAQSTAGMDNIRFLDLQPLAQLNALLNTADIHLLPQLPGAQDLVMPSKLTNILASGKPVIATAEPDSQVAQVASQAGLVVPPQHLSAFVAAIDTLAGDANKRHQLGACGREFACEKLDQNKWLQTVFADWL